MVFPIEQNQVLHLDRRHDQVAHDTIITHAHHQMHENSPREVTRACRPMSAVVLQVYLIANRRCIGKNQKIRLNQMFLDIGSNRQGHSEMDDSNKAHKRLTNSLGHWEEALAGVLQVAVEAAAIMRLVT